MQKCKSVLSLSQTREQLGLNDNEIVVYVKSGYLHPLIKFGIDSEENIICEDFFTAKHERIAYFDIGIRNFNDEICFDCREIQALRDFRLDLDKVGNHCPDMKPDPDYVPEWERTIVDPGFVPRAPERPALPYAPTPLPFPIGGQSEELAVVRAQLAEITKKWEQATARADFLDRERARNRRESERLQDELAKMREAQAQDQGGDAEQAEALEGTAPTIQPGDNTRDRFEEETTPKGRGSYLAVIDALIGAQPKELDRDFSSWLAKRIADLGYDSPKERAIRGMMSDLREYRETKKRR